MVAVNFCKHGVYVGGCGIDWMCQRCEDGTPDPTPRELRAELGRIVDDAEGLIAKLAETTASRTAIAEVVEYIFWQSYERAERRLIRLRVPIVPPSAVGARINRITQRPEGARHAQEHL